MLAAQIAVTDEGFPIGRDVVGDVDLVEEPRRHVEGLEEKSVHRRAVEESEALVARFNARNALQRPGAPIVLAFAGDLTDVGLVE